MTYSSGAAFRRALEDRLLVQSRESGLALVRLRKLVAFDRLLARLAVAQPGQWLLKGGVALQLRLGSLARTTRDMDLLLALPHSAVYASLTHTARRELADWRLCRPRSWRAIRGHCRRACPSHRPSGASRSKRCAWRWASAIWILSRRLNRSGVFLSLL